MPEQMTITCPHCAFRKTVPEALIPARASRVTCPKCRQRFYLAEGLGAAGSGNLPLEVGGFSPTPPAPPAVPPSAAVPPPPMAVSLPRELIFSFNGSARDYFGIWIVNTLLKIVTLGIYSAWAKVRRRCYFYGSTTLDGHAFEYLADPLTLFKGWLIAALAAVLYGVGTRISPLLSAAIAMIVFAAFPWLVVRSRMFNCRNSAHRNIRFSFRPDYRQAYLVFMGLPFLTPFTLGLLMPYAIYRQKKFLVENSSYGVTPFTFDATPRDFYKMALKVAGCVVAMVGLGAGWIALMGVKLTRSAHMAGGGPPEAVALGAMLAFFLMYFFVAVYGQTLLANLTLNATSLGGTRLISSLRTQDMAWLFLSNAVAVIVTLGLLMPWATVRLMRYRLERLQVQAPRGLEHLLAAPGTADVGAAGEEIGDLFGFSIDVAL